jgi:DNA polymerase (family X)
MAGRGTATAWRGGDHARCAHRLASVPGIGPALAGRLHELLDVHTVEEFETAAHDGRLARVPGFGARRVRSVVETLAGRLGPRPRPAAPPRPPLPIAELLDVDREYREKAARGMLIRIAPHRFNPEHRRWLPVLRTRRDGRQYTALFSNTARAHSLGKTDDWVVLYGDDGLAEREATVVTETVGPLLGRRVVRGREAECAEFHAAS